MDREKVEAFLDRFVDIASGATTIGLLSVADRSGLLAHLGEAGGGTVEEIAEEARLEPRYVKEILSGLAAAGAIDYDAETQRFDLSPEHALFLSDHDSPYFMGGWFDMIPTVLAQVDGIAAATRNGGGVGFEEFGSRMVKGIDRGNGPSQKAFLIKRWLPGVPGLTEKLDTGISIADVGSGAGTAAILMAKAYPDCQVVGFDNSEASIAVARARSDGLANVEFEEYAVEHIPSEPPFDLITSFDVIHDLADPLSGLQRICEALAVDGQFLMMEPNISSNLEDNLDPRGALLYGISTLHCLTQSLARDGEGLGAAWGRQKAEEYAQEAGFGSFRPLEEISNRFSSFFLLTP